MTTQTTQSVEDMENTVKYLFDLERKNFDADCKILALEFEIALRKEMFENLKKIYQSK